MNDDKLREKNTNLARHYMLETFLRDIHVNYCMEYRDPMAAAQELRQAWTEYFRTIGGLPADVEPLGKTKDMADFNKLLMPLADDYFELLEGAVKLAMDRASQRQDG